MGKLTTNPVPIDYAIIFLMMAGVCDMFDRREYTVLTNHSSGVIVQMEVGAMLVGKISNSEECRPGIAAVAGKTMKSVLISCAARLTPFDIQELRDITMYDVVEA